MNETMTHFPILAPLLLLLSACSSQVTPTSPPLEGAKMGGPFSLTDGDGRIVKSSVFAGKYRLVYFGYTFCPDICPGDMDKLMRGYRMLEKSDSEKAQMLQPIFITVDPDRDGPKEVKQFVSAFHPKLIGLTGSLEDIKSVAKAYGVYFSKQAPSGSDGYLVDHTNLAILYGPDGEPIANIAHDSATTPEEISAELGRWIR